MVKLNRVWYFSGLHEFHRDEILKAHKEHGINLTDIHNRSRVGWSKEKILTTPKRGQKSKEYTRQDVEEAEQNGINESTFRTRVCTYGWAIEEAKTRPLIKGRPKKYPGVHDDALKNGVNPYNAYQRLARGWDYEKAVSLPAIPEGQHRNHKGDRGIVR